MIHIILAIMTFGCVFSADLPREAQRELDSFNSAVEKADNARAAAVNAAVDKAVKALNAAAQKAKTVEERRAIDDEILRISKLKVEVDVLGDGGLPAPIRGLIGKWNYRVGPDPYVWVFKADGTLTYTYKGGDEAQAKWEYRPKEGKVRIQYKEDTDRYWDEIILPLVPTGTKVNNHYYGASSGTAVKEGAK